MIKPRPSPLLPRIDGGDAGQPSLGAGAPRLLVSYGFLLIALWLWGRDMQPGSSARAWQRFALIAVALGIVEMVFHTACSILRGCAPARRRPS